ncbi:coenzyme gamma-F420-2:alpha-L-glutamate ligase [Methanocaldococcus sp.]
MITIISPEAKSNTIYRIKEEIIKLGERCKIFKLSSSNYILDQDFLIDSNLIHPRCSIGFYEDRLTLYSWQFLNSLSIYDYKFVNSLETIYLTSDKFKTIKLLKKHNLNVPKTALIRDYEDAIKFMEKYSLDFPIIVKCCFSKSGEKVFKINSFDELKKITKNALWENLIIQEYLDFKSNGFYKDIRLLVLDNKIFGYSRVSRDFRTNLHLGNKVERVEINKDLEDIAYKCQKIAKAKILGVDILPYKGEYYVIELNSAPGTAGFLSLGVNVDKEIAKLLIKEDKS